MNKKFEQGKDEISKLCKYFSANQKEFLAPGIKEAHVRQSLIDPMFEALGWDVRNSNQIAPQYREVIPEDSLEIEGSQKAPDYSFRVGTLTKFYAEAKRCGINIHKDPNPAYQLRRYGWSAKVALSILTDFEEMGIYDCTIRPKPGDKAGHARIEYFGFQAYPDHWREIWDVFSREAVWTGSFDNFVAAKRKRGTSEVDIELLKEIEKWRINLARNMALRNEKLSSDELNTSVQKTIDRIIFLRMAEDRGIEPYQKLLDLCKSPNIYSRFVHELCFGADEKYNSGLFHFNTEDEIYESPDKITPKLKVDDKVLKHIIKGLYFEYGSPYHFGVFPVEILGTVYERFLGKVIRLTPGHQAKIEDKPEVRKAGGVYYTPAYVVDYIVEQTVGVMVDGKSPSQLAGSNRKHPIRILDMACGSGSFLLGAYQHLLDHCLKWYVEHNPSRYKKAVFKDERTGGWRLTLEEKKRILITHIFGVDIDEQAVEVSKLSLLLKVLEGETDQTIGRQQQLFQERALPNLSDNVKCGNALVGQEILSNELIVDYNVIKRINPLDWSAAFPVTGENKGFDCIIGNPPYGSSLSEIEKKYLSDNLDSYASVPDTYIAFVEKAFSLLKRNGILGVILPSAWLGGPAYSAFREYILKQTLETIVLLPFDVFKDAYIDTVIITARNLPVENKHGTEVYEYPKKEKIVSISLSCLNTNCIKQAAWSDKIVLNLGILKLLERIQLQPCQPIRNSVAMKRGVLFDKTLLTDRKTCDNSYPYFEGSIYRYSVLYDFPGWVEYGVSMKEYPRDFHWFEGPRILLRRLVNRRQRLMACFADKCFVTNKNLYVIEGKGRESIFYILGIINSKLFSRLYLAQVTQATKDDFPQVTIRDFLEMPFRNINFDDVNDRKTHDQLVKLVKARLALRTSIEKSQSEDEELVLNHQVDRVEREIDQRVYGLYGLSKKEIEVIE